MRDETRQPKKKDPEADGLAGAKEAPGGAGDSRAYSGLLKCRGSGLEKPASPPNSKKSSRSGVGPRRRGESCTGLWKPGLCKHRHGHSVPL